MATTDEYTELASAYSANKNDIVELKIMQARLEEKFDSHMSMNDQKLSEVIEMLRYTNGKVRLLDMWKSRLEGKEEGLKAGGGRVEKIVWTKVLIAVIKLIGVIVGALSTAYVAFKSINN